MFSEHHGVKVERGKRKKIKKSLNMVRLNNVSLNNPWVKEDFIRETEKTELSEKKNKMSKNVRYS